MPAQVQSSVLLLLLQSDVLQGVDELFQLASTPCTSRTFALNASSPCTAEQSGCKQSFAVGAVCMTVRNINAADDWQNA